MACTESNPKRSIATGLTRLLDINDEHTDDRPAVHERRFGES